MSQQMKKILINRAFFLLPIVALNACSSSHVPSASQPSHAGLVVSQKPENVRAGIPEDPQDDPFYSSVISRWERDVTLYQELQLNFAGSAVLMSPEMSDAYIKRAAHVQGVSVKLDTNIIPEQHDILPVVVTSYTPQEAFLEMEDAKIWNLTLLYNHQWLHPSSVTFYRNKASLSAYFPSGSVWSRMYVVQFRVPPELGSPSHMPLPIVFSMHSGIAKADFFWRPENFALN